MLGFPKGKTRKQEKAKKVRVESQRAQQIRAQVGERDGDCRLNDPSLWLLFGSCTGESEWAHLGEKRRCMTRGMSPEDRHTTAGSLRLCTGHHRAYDRHVIDIQPATSRGADGPLAVKNRLTIYVEPRR